METLFQRPFKHQRPWAIQLLLVESGRYHWNDISFSNLFVLGWEKPGCTSWKSHKKYHLHPIGGESHRVHRGGVCSNPDYLVNLHSTQPTKLHIMFSWSFTTFQIWRGVDLDLRFLVNHVTRPCHQPYSIKPRVKWFPRSFVVSVGGDGHDILHKSI